MAERRRRRPEPSEKASAYAAVVAEAIDKVERVLIRDDLTRKEALDQAEDDAARAIAAVFYALSPALAKLSATDDGREPRSQQVDALNFLRTAGVLPDILGPLSEELHFAGRRSNSTSSDELYWQSVAVQAFDLLVQRHNLSVKKAIELVEEHLEDQHPELLMLKTFEGWRARVRHDAIYQNPIGPSFAHAFRRSGKKGLERLSETEAQTALLNRLTDAIVSAHRAARAAKKTRSAKKKTPPKRRGELSKTYD